MVQRRRARSAAAQEKPTNSRRPHSFGTESFVSAQLVCQVEGPRERGVEGGGSFVGVVYIGLSVPSGRFGGAVLGREIA
jgi:hypothetical protein